MRHEALEELIEAADAVWEDAAHSGTGRPARTGGHGLLQTRKVS